MTVQQIIDALSQFDPDTEVMTAAPSHDYWGTVTANKVGTIDTANVTYSDYHNTHKVVDDEKIYNYDGDEVKEVVLLSM
jgi:hypothetical protein